MAPKVAVKKYSPVPQKPRAAGVTPTETPRNPVPRTPITYIFNDRRSAPGRQ